MSPGRQRPFSLKDQVSKLLLVLTISAFLLQKKSPPEQAKSRTALPGAVLKVIYVPNVCDSALIVHAKTQQGLAQSKLLPNRMSAWPSRIPGWKAPMLLMALLGAAALPSRLFADSATPRTNTAQIECITPDGRQSAISHPHVVDSSSAASIVDDTTVSCPLREGDTTFVIALSINGRRDRFTFINENAAACGELKIAVADSRLAADSPKWTEVDGIIPFSHKRLFNLSMLGVEKRFVRLTFHVEIARNASTGRKVTPIRNTFHFSALEAAINRHFAVSAHAQTLSYRNELRLVSVAPFPPCLTNNCRS